MHRTPEDCGFYLPEDTYSPSVTNRPFVRLLSNDVYLRGVYKSITGISVFYTIPRYIAYDELGPYKDGTLCDYIRENEPLEDLLYNDKWLVQSIKDVLKIDINIYDTEEKIQVYTKEDLYSYKTDNRPLHKLLENDLKIEQVLKNL